MARKKISLSPQDQRLQDQRAKLWPDITPQQLWNREQDGYASVPRPLPLFIEVIDAASKRVSTSGKAVPAGRAYLALCCRVSDVAMVKINSETALALETGYPGQRAVLVWREHLRVLRDLGFIRIAPAAEGEYAYILLLNPYQVCEALATKGWIVDRLKNAIDARALEIKAVAPKVEEVVS
jgi:hypothetical protein